MMIGISIVGLAAFGVPFGRVDPVFSAVARQMQVNAAAENMVGIGRVNRDRVAVRHLAFFDEVRSSNVCPVAPTVVGPEDTEDAVFLCAGDGVDERRLGRGDGQGANANEIAKQEKGLRGYRIGRSCDPSGYGNRGL